MPAKGSKRFRWTPELDARLIECVGRKMTTYQAAKEMGIRRETVKKRSVVIGVRFGRYTKLQAQIDNCHIAADERSAELLRAAGVRI